MGKYWKTTLAVILMLVFATTFTIAKSGSPIPVPRISIIEAISLATGYFRSGKTKLIDPEYAKIEEYILISAQYTKRFDNNLTNNWAWKIRFVHPVINDHSVTYKVTDDRKIVEISVTE
ncbi:hypothetical protein ACFL35_05995 [Candidatus Riflebacteria bacterium]